MTLLLGAVLNRPVQNVSTDPVWLRSRTHLRAPVHSFRKFSSSWTYSLGWLRRCATWPDFCQLLWRTSLPLQVGSTITNTGPDSIHDWKWRIISEEAIARSLRCHCICSRMPMMHPPVQSWRTCCSCWWLGKVQSAIININWISRQASADQCGSGMGPCTCWRCATKHILIETRHGSVIQMHVQRQNQLMPLTSAACTR